NNPTNTRGCGAVPHPLQCRGEPFDKTRAVGSRCCVGPAPHRLGGQIVSRRASAGASGLAGRIINMQELTFEEALERILARDTRYHREAYVFVRNALDYTRKLIASDAPAPGTGVEGEGVKARGAASQRTRTERR